MVKVLKWFFEPLDRWLWRACVKSGFILLGKDTPDPPDPAVTAAAQGQENRDTAQYNATLNRINQFTPLGSMTYSQTPTFDQAGYDKDLAAYAANKSAYDAAVAKSQAGGKRWVSTGTGSDGFWVDTVPMPVSGSAPSAPDRANYMTGAPTWSSHVTLDPKVQSILDSQLSNDLAMSTLAGQQMDSLKSMLGQPITSVNQDEVMNAMMSRLEPRFQQDEESLRTRLGNMGLTAGTEAWDKEFANFGQQKNDARQQALLASNQFAGQNLQNQQLQRSIPLNEFLALKNGSQVSMPSFQQAGQSQAGTTNVSDLIMQGYQNELGAANAQNAQEQQAAQAAASLAMLGIMMGSDIRIKKDIKRVGRMDDGTPIYTFRYINGDPRVYMGVMAQDIEKTNPSAVAEFDGVKMVNYGAL